MDLNHILYELQNGQLPEFNQLRKCYSEIQSMYVDFSPQFIISLKKSISKREIPSFSHLSVIFEDFYMQIYNMTQPKRRHTIIRSSLDMNSSIINIILTYESIFTATISSIISASHKITQLIYSQNLLIGYSSQGIISAQTLQGRVKYHIDNQGIIESLHIISTDQIFAVGMMNIRDLKTGKFISTIEKIVGSPSTYSIFEDKIIIGTHQGMIYIFDSLSGNKERGIRVSMTGVRAILPFKNKIISGDDNGQIELWDLISDRLIPISIHYDKINFITQLGGTTLMSASDRLIKIYDLNLRSVVYSIAYIHGAIKVITIQNKHIIQSSKDGLYLLYNGNISKIGPCYKYKSIDLFYDHFFISYSSNKLLIWDVNTCETSWEVDINIDSLTVLPNKRIAVSYQNIITILE